MRLSPALIAHFSRNYMEFIALAPHLPKEVACDACHRIWLHIYYGQLAGKQRKAA
jgi:hypothetical protein